jgi:hypothetical protein
MQIGMTEINDLLLAKLVGTSRHKRVKRWIEVQDWRDENIGIDKLEVVTFWGENAVSVYITEAELRKFAQDILNALPVVATDEDDYVNDCLANQEVI